MQQWLAQPPGSAVPESHHKAANNGLCCGPRNRAAAAAAPAAGGSTGSGSGASSRPVLHTMVLPGPAAASAAAHAPAPAAPARAASAGATNSSHCCGAGVTHHLVAYPAKDNYEGRIYPLDWIEQVSLSSLPAWYLFTSAAAEVRALQHWFPPARLLTPACVNLCAAHTCLPACLSAHLPACLTVCLC